MRAFFLLGVVACASALPTAEGPPTAPPNDPIAAHDTANEAPEEPETVTMLRVPGRSAEELLSAAGLATYLEDRDLRLAQVDDGAMERWFSRKPSVVYLYSERPIEVSEAETVRADCRRVSRADDAVLNELSVALWQQGARRALVQLGQTRAVVAEQRRERGRWETDGVRPLSVGLAAWDDEHARYAEGAEIHEVACAHAVRSVPCVEGGALLGPRGRCLDRELVVRPWRAPTVPHVGGVIPAYPDRIPNVPTGECAIECAPSACDEALRRAPLPRAPLYTDDAPVIAAFRTPAACRAFATSRAAYTSNDGPW
jgi:hypothetical protein